MNYDKQDDFSYFKSLLLIINWIKLLSTYLTLWQTCLGNFHLCIYACPSLTYSAGTLRLMPDNHKYKPEDCNPEAGGCRCWTAVRSTQPASLKILKSNQMSPKAIKPKACCASTETPAAVPVVFRAALICPGLVMDSPRFRGIQTTSVLTFGHPASR